MTIAWAYNSGRSCPKFSWFKGLRVSCACARFEHVPEKLCRPISQWHRAREIFLFRTGKFINISKFSLRRRCTLSCGKFLDPGARWHPNKYSFSLSHKPQSHIILPAMNQSCATRFGLCHFRFYMRRCSFLIPQIVSLFSKPPKPSLG